MLLGVKEPGCMDCFIPNKYKDADTFEKTMEDFEVSLNNETMKPFINSGHAFVCFDSVQSLNTVLKHFRTTPSQHIKIFFIGIKEKIVNCCGWLQGRDSPHNEVFDSRGRARSNFLRDSENQNYTVIDYDNPQHVILCNKASEPLDILWKNMGVIETPFAFTRFFLFIIGLVIIFFLSSPAVMLARL